MKETEYIQKMNLEIPEHAKNLAVLEPKIEGYVCAVKDTLDRYKQILEKIPKELVPLMKTNKENVDMAMKPGLTSVTWLSTNLEDCNYSFLLTILSDWTNI